MVATPSQTDTYSTALDIFDRTHPLRVDADENLKVTGNVTVTPSGIQDVFIENTSPILVTGAVALKPSVDAIGTEETVFTTRTALLAPNAARLGFVVQINTVPVDIWLGTTAVPTYHLTAGSVLEVENFVGAVFGTVSTGSSTVLVTEKI